jgi:hypothetical protein
MDEQLKQMLMIPVLVACLTVMTLQIFLNGFPMGTFAMWKLALNILAGAALGAGVFFFLKSRS